MLCVFLSVSNIFQVNNNCATGSTALMLAKQIIEGGMNMKFCKSIQFVTCFFYFAASTHYFCAVDR